MLSKYIQVSFDYDLDKLVVIIKFSEEVPETCVEDYMSDLEGEISDLVLEYDKFLQDDERIGVIK